MPARRPIAETFSQHIRKTSGCWFWTGSDNTQGYGIIRRGARRLMAHRVAYELFIGKIPSGMLVCHHCDNPPCVRPDHLFIGTAKDNIRDCVSKGRSKEQKKTHCPRGHRYTAENTKIVHDGARNCRECAREQHRQYWERKGGREAYNAYMRQRNANAKARAKAVA